MSYKVWFDSKRFKIGSKSAKDGEWHSYSQDGTEMCVIKFGIVKYDAPNGNRSWSILFLKWMVSAVWKMKI